MNSMNQDETAGTDGLNASPALVLALKRLLRPLVRLLLAKGITYPYLSGLLKTIYVDVAAHDFPLKGKRQTDSRLSLLTGVHRKDVHRFMNEPRDTGAAPPNVSFGSRLVARWCGEADYLDESGEPRPLPRHLLADGGPSFERLVADESTDIRARAVLDEWLRLGLVAVDDEDRVCLKSSAFVPEQGFEEKAYFLGRNVRDHLAAATHNVLNEKPPFLERSVYSDRLSEAATDELAALSEKLGMHALRTINRRVRELRTTSADGQPMRRITFGIYYYSEARTPDGEPADGDA
ncbi:MAG: DUF6502 family protein [Rhodocyclaceae bacterium]|nr:DUF6502 family protein [Rhodocyclaceae bacterium]